MPGTQDLASILNQPPEDSRVDVRIGRVVSWDPASGRNTIEVDGLPLTDVKVSSSINVFTIQQGDVVVMFLLVAPSGISQWWVMGTVVTPGDNATELVVRGGSIAIEGHSLFVRGNGGVTVQDDAIFVGEYNSGRQGVYVGPIMAGGVRIGYGLLIQGDTVGQHDIIAAYQHEDGRRILGLGDTATDGELAELIGRSNEIDLRAVGDSTVVAALSSEGNCGIGGDMGTFLRPESGAGTANVRMDTITGRITYIPSIAAAKRDIQDLTVDTATVLRLRPRTWLPGPVVQQCPEWMHDRHTDPSECRAGEVVEPPEGLPREVGFVAEELEAIGLTEFVDYDSEGAAASIRYDRLAAALIPVVQEQQSQIAALQTALDALSARVAVLEPSEETP